MDIPVPPQKTAGKTLTKDKLLKCVSSCVFVSEGFWLLLVVAKKIHTPRWPVHLSLEKSTKTQTSVIPGDSLQRTTGAQSSIM